MNLSIARRTQSIVATFAIILAANLAFAGNEGPQAAPNSPPPASQDPNTQQPPSGTEDHKPLPGFVVAKIVTGGGMPMPGRCMIYTTTVYSTGSVVFDTCGENLRLLTTVTRQWITYVLKRAENLKPAELVILNPKAPPAADAGFTTKSVLNAQGEMIAVTGSIEARETVRKTRRTDGSDALREAFHQLDEKISKSR